MPTNLNPEHGKGVWAGDPSKVADARAAYANDPEGHLITLAVALYSFRDWRRFRYELLELRLPLEERVARLIDEEPDGTSDHEKADQAEVLCTYLEWMSRRRELNSAEQKEAGKAAFAAYRWGMCYVSTDPKHVHTYCFFRLRLASMQLRDHDRRAALWSIKQAEEYADKVADPKQRDRVYRLIGVLHRRCWNLVPGMYWGIRACLVPGVPARSRLKSLAAFVRDV